MTLALEINDAGIVLARDGHVVAEVPGCAMLDEREPQTGEAAVQRARLRPLYAETRYWQDLGTEPLQRPMPAASSFADIAYAQLAQIAREAGVSGSETLYAVPAWYTREQLGVLLGVAREAGLPAVGLVDAGLAAAALEPVPAGTVHLELSLHRATLTVLEHLGELRRVRYELLPQHGWLALQQAWIDMAGAAFVRKTRFDPLHEAAGEQRLWDGLPGWLDRGAGGRSDAGGRPGARRFRGRRTAPVRRGGAGAAKGAYARRAAAGTRLASLVSAAGLR